MAPTTKVLALPETVKPGERGRFLDAHAVLATYLTHYKVRGRKPTVRFVRNLLRGIAVKLGPKTSGYWSKDVEAFLAGQKTGRRG